MSLAMIPFFKQFITQHLKAIKGQNGLKVDLYVDMSIFVGNT